MTSPLLPHLPDDFVWGVATSAYQIEGGTTRDGRSASIWDTFAHTLGRTRHGETGDVACDHRARWAADLDLLQELQVPSYRLSLSWPRLQPGGHGTLNPDAVDWYRQLMTGLHERNIRPFVTLYHWDLPQELEDVGGWTNRDTAAAFAAYSGQVAAALGDLVSDWITINEPWCAAFLGYGLGVHAPGVADFGAAVAAAHHLNLAHGLATAAIRDAAPDAAVGVTNIVADLLPADPGNAEDVAAVERVDAVNHKLFLAPVFTGTYPSLVHELLDSHGLADLVHAGDLEIISAPLDFVGVNHYQQVAVTSDPEGGPAQASESPTGTEHTSFGWSITPHALTTVLQQVQQRYTDLPAYVTENGASFNDYVTPDGHVHDPERIDYLTGYLEAIDAAAAAGVHTAGYFAWSFLDNYEWAEGYDKRFGLVFVDFGTQTRIPKDSARFYTDTITAHQVRAAVAPLTA
jgi:beta-glucosidase